jgi:hypothetical protein
MESNMSKEIVIKHVEDVIRIISRDIKKRKLAKSDEVRQLTGLVNAYSRLTGASIEIPDEPDPENGDPEYYEKVVLKKNGNSS